MKGHAWLIDLIHCWENCPTGMLSGWVQKVIEHCGTVQYIEGFTNYDFVVALQIIYHPTDSHLYFRLGILGLMAANFLASVVAEVRMSQMVSIRSG